MATTSEDVLLVVNGVRHKKSDGTLYVMAERLAWIMNGKDAFTISHRYVDIKSQKISPEGKAKIQLQVVLHDGGASTFHFLNPLGTEAQVQDRDSVKETLLQLLPRFKRKINKELEEKNRILAEDPELFQLYRDLVTSQVLTPEEFWASHTPQQREATNATQDVGVSGAFLAGIKPQSDGCNGLKYNLTADIMESIFKTYPAVKKKHLEYVPDKMSESDFWTRFFQSHYFHRDRFSFGNKDLFAECAKYDEQDIVKEIPFTSLNPLIDLPKFVDTTLDEGYGEAAVGTSQSQSNAVNQNMIRRFNHYSMMVLKACENAEEAPKLEMNAKSKVVYEDLEQQNEAKLPSLNLCHADRYFHGPTPVTSMDYISNEELLQTVHSLHKEIASWKPALPQVLPGNLAVMALGELSPGGALMKRANLDNLQQTVPQHVQQELKNLYLAACELLRHFWSCFPVTNDQLEEKLRRMRDNLERFQYAKVIPFQDALLRDHYNTNLVDHLKETIEAAFAKFNAWQSRRILKK